MKFLRRLAPTRSGDPVSDFWIWWSTKGERDFTEAVATGNFEPIVDATTQRVKAIHPELVWQAREGTSADHMLCVTAGGVTAAREHSERWYRGAPKRGSVWEFSSVTPQPPNHDELTLFLGPDAEVALREVKFNVHVGTKLDVAVSHKHFANADQDSRAEVAFEVLDTLLGEDSVMRWIGTVDTAVDAEPDAVEPWQLQSIVAAFARQKFESWQVGEQELLQGSRSILRVRGAEWLDRPALELHCVLTLPYDSPDDTGLPSAPELERLDAIEEGLEDDSGLSRILVAIETGQGRRALHYYANPSDGVSLSPLQSYAREISGAHLEQTQDPFWDVLKALRHPQ